jgi:hypothetical protein
LVVGGRARLRWWRVGGGWRAVSLSIWRAARGLEGGEAAREGDVPGRNTNQRLVEGTLRPCDSRMGVTGVGGVGCRQKGEGVR